jgi:hypothetical protein
MREVDLASATYADACDGFGNEGDFAPDDSSVTLSGGAATLTVDAGVTYEVTLESVGCGDADGDGDEDAVVFLNCTFDGGNSHNPSGLMGAYRATPGGGIEQIGGTQAFGSPTYSLYIRSGASVASSASDLSITVDLVVHADGDPTCCPSSGVTETWTFTGGAFSKTGSTPFTPGSF